MRGLETPCTTRCWTVWTQNVSQKLMQDSQDCITRGYAYFQVEPLPLCCTHWLFFVCRNQRPQTEKNQSQGTDEAGEGSEEAISRCCLEVIPIWVRFLNCIPRNRLQFVWLCTQKDRKWTKLIIPQITIKRTDTHTCTLTNQGPFVLRPWLIITTNNVQTIKSSCDSLINPVTTTCLIDQVISWSWFNLFVR